MKKIILLCLIVLTATACSSDSPDNPDGSGGQNNPATQFGKPAKPLPQSQWTGSWNDPKNPNYNEAKGPYNPIYGDWIVTHRNGVAYNDFLVYEFAGWDWYLADKKPLKDKAPNYRHITSYDINNVSINTTKKGLINYTINSNRTQLILFDGSMRLTLAPYDNNGVWKWHGDWNYPRTPEYHPEYGGKYNPIVGTWSLIKVGGQTISYYKFFRFSENFMVTTASSLIDIFSNERKYVINDIGVKEDAYGIHQSYTFSYKISNDTLYYRTELPGKGEGMTLIRYKK